MTTVGNVHDTYAAGVRSLDYYRDHYVDWLARWTYYRFVRLCEKLAVPRLEGIIANSEHTAKKLIEEYRISPERIHVCYVCIESKDYVVTSGIHNLGGSDSPRVLFVGGNMQRKGLPTLIRAAPDIVNAVPNIEFWVVGRDRIEPHMRQLCRDRDVSRYFRFLGWKPHGELIQMYAEADIFVMPSLEEALGVTFLEAMASRVPSIGTRVGGIPELIDHGYNGLLIDPEDVSALAQAVVELINSTRLHRRLVDGGLTTVNRFTVEKMMQCTHRTYQALLCK
jgi:glycosyltransferase involved in cell wall biosynthesis